MELKGYLSAGKAFQVGGQALGLCKASELRSQEAQNNWRHDHIPGNGGPER